MGISIGLAETSIALGQARNRILTPALSNLEAISLTFSSIKWTFSENLDFLWENILIKAEGGK